MFMVPRSVARPSETVPGPLPGRRPRSRAARLLSLLAGLLFVSGCASPQMKGTPFYSGEYDIRRGPAEDRVNLWPLLYYRDPALSLLWPFIELTDDHFAVRPVASVYGLDEDLRVYNVVWPLAQFDHQRETGRVFPFFWGRHYRALFPLYWHFDPHDGQGFYDGFFPLWSHRRDSRGTSTHVAWPLFHVQDRDNVKGWRLWPLVGDYTKPDGDYSYLFWPFWHRWSGKAGESGGSAFVPLYWYGHDATSERFLSLPYSRAKYMDGSSWDLLLPLMYRSRNNHSSKLLTPLYLRGADRAAGSSWSALLPLYLRQQDSEGGLFATLLGGAKWSGADSSWFALPLLAGGHADADARSGWAGGPLIHWSRDGRDRSAHAFPLFYSRHTPEGDRFVSIPWSSSTSAGGDAWQLLPPLFYHRKSGLDEDWITPLWSHGVRGAEGTRWSSVFPFYYHNAAEGTWLSPVVARWRRRDERATTLIPPLLSTWTRDEQGGDLWALGGLGHWSWGDQAESNHLLPLYYSAQRKHQFVSPLFAGWGNPADGGRTTVVPPALSWKTTDRDRSDLWLAGPIAHASWGEKPGASHLLPLFYRNPATETFLSPLVASWKSDGDHKTIIPPLLSSYSRGPLGQDLWAGLGLFHHCWPERPENRQGHMVPFYYYEKDLFLSPLFGWGKGPPSGFVYPLTPLAGWRTGDITGSWLFPLYSHTVDSNTGESSRWVLWSNWRRQGKRTRAHFIPFFWYSNTGAPPPDEARPTSGRYGADLNFALLGWHKDAVKFSRRAERTDEGVTKRTVRVLSKKHGLFPLWHYSREACPEDRTLDTSASILLALYDHKHEMRQARGAEDEPTDYTRNRVLWRLWHYERLNDDISVDLFPGITYDRKGREFKKVSFLWRCFRYERSTTGRKVDLLFMPILR